MTQGGPLDSTLSVSFHAYNQFSFGNYGYTAASATCCSSRSPCSPCSSSGCCGRRRERPPMTTTVAPHVAPGRATAVDAAADRRSVAGRSARAGCTSRSIVGLRA